MSKILVADDNALSLQFLVDAVHMLGTDCHTASDGAAALREACAIEFDLLLLDYRMPKLSASGVLHELRSNPNHASAKTPAIVTSAQIHQNQLNAWLAEGFIDALEKPCSIAEIARLLHKHLATGFTANLLDDAQGLSTVGGDASILHSLRNLLADELQSLDAELHTILLKQDFAALNDRLHRLRASAGFCGVPGLQNAISEFGRVVQSNPNASHFAFDHFSATCRQVRDLLRNGAPP